MFFSSRRGGLCAAVAFTLRDVLFWLERCCCAPLFRGRVICTSEGMLLRVASVPHPGGGQDQVLPLFDVCCTGAKGDREAGLAVTAWAQHWYGIFLGNTHAHRHARTLTHARTSLHARTNACTRRLWTATTADPLRHMKLSTRRTASILLLVPLHRLLSSHAFASFPPPRKVIVSTTSSAASYRSVLFLGLLIVFYVSILS